MAAAPEPTVWILQRLSFSGGGPDFPMSQFSRFHQPQAGENVEEREAEQRQQPPDPGPRWADIHPHTQNRFDLGSVGWTGGSRYLRVWAELQGGRSCRVGGAPVS